MTQTIDSLFIEAGIAKLDDAKTVERKEDDYTIYTYYDWEILHIIKKVKQYLTLDGKAA